MGDFLIKVHAVGGHGCERKAQAGETFHGCGFMACPDCLATEFVQKLAAAGVMVESATLQHWPPELNHIGRSYDEAHEVVDDLNYRTAEGYRSPRLRKRIKGSFGG